MTVEKLCEYDYEAASALINAGSYQRRWIARSNFRRAALTRSPPYLRLESSAPSPIKSNDFAGLRDRKSK